LLLAFAGLGAVSVVTGVAAKTYHAQRRALAQEWHSRGANDLKAGRAQAALTDFRTAMTYGRENISDEQLEGYQLDLAEALVAAGRVDEARSYLLDLWQRAPGNGEINLDLARLAARNVDDEDARRYYDGAINGVWEGKPDQVAKDRIETRLELYSYLASRGEPPAAQSVLLAAAASLPPDSLQTIQVGQLMLESGHAQQALTEFEQALRVDRRSTAALTGAGMASFNLGDDAATVRYLQDASREKAEQALPSADAEQISRTLAVARITLAIDPLRSGLDAPERARRTVRSYDAAVARIESCAALRNITLPKTLPKVPTDSTPAGDLPGMYTKLMQMRPSVLESDLIRHPERVGPAMNLVFAAEGAATGECGSPQDPADVAIARIAARSQGGQP
jgi:tetratricopeptide (TPR) repeat protein